MIAVSFHDSKVSDTVQIYGEITTPPDQLNNLKAVGVPSLAHVS
jgi:hypothetical protein